MLSLNAAFTSSSSFASDLLLGFLPYMKNKLKLTNLTIDQRSGEGTEREAGG